jgi:group I intron endonuclease
MTIGIYKIENLLTHKIYIGQSVHIETRWSEHCRPSANSVISNAIHKYGKDNFSFEILKKCKESELDKWEEYYINFYNSIVPNGYNVEEKVEGSKNIFSKYSKETFQNIIYDIKFSTLSFNDIANKYSLDKSMIYYINRGAVHTIADETYPLRRIRSSQLKSNNCCIDCGKIIHKNSQRCLVCDHKRQQRCERPTRETLKYLIRNKSFLQIGKIYGVTDQAVRKWCKYYNLPMKKTDIKNIDDNKWAEI